MCGVCAWCMQMYVYFHAYTMHTYTVYVCAVYARVCIGMYVYVLHTLANNERVLSRPNAAETIMVKRLTYTFSRTKFSTLSRRTHWKRRT